jgi:hypothetical protein
MPDAGKTKQPSAEPLSDHRLRVFISYSHEDKDLVKTIAKVIKKNGMSAIYVKKGLQVGTGFPAEIIHFISHAHIFLPLLTKTSLKRRWVQQEIGFAVASRVPTVPVAIRCEPGEFLYGIQAIQLKTLDKAELQKRLTRDALEKCLQRYPLGGALYECADTTEERAVLFAQYARAVILSRGSGMVRQLGGLSSFHIPDQTIDHPDWQSRYGDKHQSEYHRKVLLEERLALTEHAKKKGCRIVIDLDIDYKFYGGDAKRSRLQRLLRFLHSMPDPLCEVAIAGQGLSKSMTSKSTTIVGDWFAAQSISGKPGQGYKQTIFTRHSPTIARMIEEFDRRFAQCLDGLPAEKSREYAIGEIERRIADLPPVQATAASGKG